MSEENVELARRAYDAISRRDLDALLALMDPEVVALPRILAVEGGGLHGHDGIRRWWESIFSAFPDFGTEVVAVRAIGEWTISEVRARGRGEGSGTPFADSIWVASRVRDGKVVRWQTFASEGAALKAAFRSSLETYAAGDWTALRELYDPDVVMHHLEGWPEPGPSVGREAVLREFQQLRESSQVQTIEITDVVVGGDRIAARYLWRGKGRGPDTEMEFSFVFAFRNGRVIDERHFWDHAEALEAMGLAQQP